MRTEWFLPKVFTLIVAVIFASLSVRAQTFSSGSTGADGPLDLASGNRVVQLPESGILNYTTVNIPAGRNLFFAKNFRNTPVVMLATGNVTVAGEIQVAGTSFPLPTQPGPGGFHGGYPSGHGPGGGQAQQPNPNANQCTVSHWVGNLSLVPIIGGSGAGCGGTGGGGAIVIASSTSIAVSGVISADGAHSFQVGNGSGGAIRLVANSVTVSGALTAKGQFSTPGVIRLEAPAGFLHYSGTADPLPILSTSINPMVLADGNTPDLNIVSVGGFPVSYTAGRPDFVDLILPTQVIDPINIVVRARNIAVGTLVNLNLSGPSSGTFTPGTLSGTQASSSTTIAISGLSRSGSTYLIAFADFTLPASAANINRKGSDHIAKVRIIAKPGLDSRLVFIRKNGTEIDLAKVPSAIRRQFGL
jgi:hypothetical protein